MMSRSYIWVTLFLFVAGAGMATRVSAGLEGTAVGRVTYVSIEGVYVDAGTGAGLAVGDTLNIYRDTALIATVVINNVSTSASAAIVITKWQAITAGDQAFSVKQIVTSGVSKSEKLSEAVVDRSSKKERSGVRYRGNVSLSNYLHQDLTKSDLGWTRPGLATRMTVDNIGQAGLRFELRHRSRLYHRNRAVRMGEKKDEWSHQVYQMALFNDDESGATEWGVGRLITPYVRGVGYVDGGYVARRVGDKVKVGLAAGTIPDRENGSFNTDIRKAGLFVAYQTGNRSQQLLDMSLALSTESKLGTTSRDFAYLQATYNRGNWLAMFHSAELDYNRHWRYELEGKRISFTNYFGRATISLNNKTRLFVSYDQRRAIRYIETSEIPDSLFDDRDSRGLRGGTTVRFNDRTTVGISGGIRFNDNQFKNPVTGTFSLRLNKFPRNSQSMTFYFSYISTEFTTGYRPMIYYRFPLAHSLLINLSGATHIYKTGTETTINSYADVASSYNFQSGLYVSGNIRQYFDAELKSFELFTEIGWGW